MECRKIIHIDMDAFYAAIEQRDNPSLKGKPVIVGGDPERRGVVSTCSYEARKFGVHSAMPSRTALKLCPEAVFLYPRFEAYSKASKEVMNIFSEYTDLIEPLSLDEAFLDVTENRMDNPSATILALEIKKKIFESTGLTASAGVSYNKFLAKTASDINKPDGITVIKPDEAGDFLEKLPIGKFFGIGKVSEKKMISLGITNGLELKAAPLERLVKHFGKAGRFYYDIVRGIDERPVEPVRERKSYGREITLDEDILDIGRIHSILKEIASELEGSLRKKNIRGKTITLKIKYHDFRQITRSATIEMFTDSADIILENIMNLIQFTEAGVKKVRLLGISLSHLNTSPESCEEDIQLKLPCC
ncbi:MAG TPA: DNA polymerase IV [Spirochaetota bacterium]|nr:DNA polymerase IV [Spirochaetota bacterium]HPJ34211.1 DNA polymerase IV [Spirochaetota bacterium]